MIITRMIGGTGNQLFQYAAGRRLAHKLGVELKLDTTSYKGANLHPYALNLFNVNAAIATPEEIERAKQFSKETGFEQENKNHDFMSEVLDYPDNVWLCGFWQNEKYFADISDILRREFTLKNSLGATAQHWKEKILAAECPVSLHFRHGDFIYNPLISSNRNTFAVPPLDYYYRCIDALKRDYKNLTLFIFSDDLQWVKENLRVDLPVYFVEGEDLQDVEELHLMSLCKHNVISKSTFSWWGAWLNQNPDKKVFMPALTDGKTLLKSSNNIIEQDNWLRVYFDICEQPDVALRPYFSLLLVINDSALPPQCLFATLDSLLEQDYKYCEIVIVDNASTDDSNKICREVAKAHDNVTLIKLHDKISNGAAWNIALKAAQGYYVMFLKSGDRIFPDALTSLYMLNEHIVADVVNSFIWLKEDACGNIEVNNKKFSLERIAAFQNFNGVFRDKLNKQTLLRVMTNNENFPPLGTRVFKRKFLLERRIVFDEEIGDEAEIFFTLDAIFHATNEIIFIPNIFYVAPRDKIIRQE